MRGLRAPNGLSIVRNSGLLLSKTKYAILLSYTNWCKLLCILVVIVTTVTLILGPRWSYLAVFNF